MINDPQAALDMFTDIEKTGVTGVIGVTASNGEASSDHTSKEPGVTGVIDSLTEKTGGTEGTGGAPSNDAASSRSPTEKPKGTGGTNEPMGEPVQPQPDTDERPLFATYTDWNRYGKAGLYYHGVKQDRSGELKEFDQWLCSPIYTKATTSDERGENFGLMLEFRNPFGEWRKWAMPMHLLRGSGEEMRGELLGLGVRIDSNANKLLHRWLMDSCPERRLIAATHVGWHTTPKGAAFVMPRRTLGAGDTVFQSEHAAHDEFITRGEMAGWRDDVAALCSGNPLLVLSVSSALAGPLLSLTNRAGGGLHFVGDSSTGKSTLLQVAGSVWGGTGFIRTWRATGNGLEGIAAALNDTCLILDEIGEADPREVGSIVYAIGNGTGKSRAARTGGARAAARWRVMLLSSGERSLAAHMAEGGKRSKAGQGVRLLDIPAQRHHGAFDTLHHLADGRALSDHLKTAVARHHGHLGPAFIERLLTDDQDFPALLEGFAQVEGFDSKDGLEGRAAASLALIGMAGELATEYGLTGWCEGEALDAAIDAYGAWKAFRGEGQTETRQILQAVESFITRHGDARFSDITADATTGPMVRERAGWWRNANEGRVYLFTSDGLREALQGFDFKRGLAALDDAGWIAERDDRTRSRTTRIAGSTKRLYVIRPMEEEV